MLKVSNPISTTNWSTTVSQVSATIIWEIDSGLLYLEIIL
jgi:hypothetical protein